MIAAHSAISGLLADCEAHGVRLAAAVDGGLVIDAPQETLTPELLARLKACKADLLAILRTNAEVGDLDRSDAAAAWQIALALLKGDPLFSPDLMNVLWSARVRWSCESAVATPANRDAPPTSAKPVCRCGSATWRDVPIHDGQSVRRDCDRCRRFLDFPIWYVRYALQNEH